MPIARIFCIILNPYFLISLFPYFYQYLRFSKILEDEVHLFWGEVSWCVCVASLKESYLQRNAFVNPFVQCAHSTAVAEMGAIRHRQIFFCCVLHKCGLLCVLLLTTTGSIFLFTFCCFSCLSCLSCRVNCVYKVSKKNRDMQVIWTNNCM